MRLLLTIFFAGSFAICHSQMSCGISNAEAVKISYGSVNSKSLRQSTIRIAINPIIVHQSNGQQLFSETDISLLLNKANEYFAPINYEFYIVNDGVKHIYDNQFFNLDIADEMDLRLKNDVDYAINLYLVSSIVLPNQDILSGFTSLPSLNNAGNRIVLSYLDRNNEDFQSLVEKVFPHELGHYFGLLHTFNNSNSENIDERELVTRGAGANCATAGDFICDTPADPYEKQHSIASLECGVQPPANLIDALGQQYAPSDGNLMSYQIRCGNFFSPEQYQRMLSAGNIRFSPDAAYKIIQEPKNSITLQMPTKKSYCGDEVMEIEWKSFGYFFPDNLFQFEISNAEGTNFIPADIVKVGNKAFFTISTELPAGKNYKFRVKSTNPKTTSYISDNFEIKQKGKYSLSIDRSIIDKGETAILSVNFTGSGPWTWELSDGQKIENNYQKTINLALQPIEDQYLNLKSAVGACGLIDKGNGAQLLVIAPKISIISSDNFSICEKGIVNLKVRGLQSGSSTAYTINLEGISSFIINPIISENQIQFNLPSDIKAGEKISLKIKGSNGQGDFSDIYAFEILPSPAQPFVQSPIEACFGQSDIQLMAEGENLKWYIDPVNGQFYNNLKPSSDQEGVKSYYVSQTNSFGCESLKSKIDVRVKEPLIASISGNGDILQGDSTQLRLNVSGEGPVEIVLNDGTKIEIENGTSFYFVKPNDSFTYTIKEAKNGCGIGLVNGQARVNVKIPLGIQNEMNSLIIYPNPSPNGQVKIISQSIISDIQFYNTIGHKLTHEKINDTSYILKNSSSGDVIVKVILKDGTVQSRKVVLMSK